MHATMSIFVVFGTFFGTGAIFDPFLDRFGLKNEQKQPKKRPKTAKVPKNFKALFQKMPVFSGTLENFFVLFGTAIT